MEADLNTHETEIQIEWRCQTLCSKEIINGWKKDGSYHKEVRQMVHFNSIFHNVIVDMKKEELKNGAIMEGIKLNMDYKISQSFKIFENW